MTPPPDEAGVAEPVNSVAPVDPVNPVDPVDTSIQSLEPAVDLPLVRLADGMPEVVTTERALIRAAKVIAGGSGPVALDAERASGFRYGQKAYLVQVRRHGAGTWLFDPVALPDLRPLDAAIGDGEWVLHAATQDLPCLAGVGMAPHVLFDTELGGRLAGLPRVGLRSMVEHYLGMRLAKEHSAADWSTRPLPEPWLEYAALDVEVLLDLRDAVHADLVGQDKWEWAEQEFAALTSFSGPPERVDPWRRTSGMHKIRTRRAVAAVQELWLERDRIAAQRDVSPGRVLPDAALIQLASGGSAIFSGPAQAVPRAARRNQRNWVRALDRAGAIPDQQLPPLTLPGSGPPPPKLWAERDPVAASRLDYVRRELTAFAAARTVPVENLLSPDALRRVLWQPSWVGESPGADEALERLGARPWQRAIAAGIIERAIAKYPSERTRGAI